MAEYRKAGLRTYYRIRGTIVMRVINKMYQSEVLVCDNVVIFTEAGDAETEPITESEFTEQYNIAIERIKNMKV